MRSNLRTWIVFLFIFAITGCAGQSGNVGEEDSDAMTSQAANASSSAITKPRIVATTVAITEMMDALDLDLAGIPTSSKTLPVRYENVQKVGNPMSPDMELVKSLQPTEVLSVTTLEYDLKPAFESAGIVAQFLNFTSLKNMESALLSLGEKYDRKEEADRIVSSWTKQIQEIQNKSAEKKAPKVLILLGVPGSYLVATENSYIGDLVKIAGGENIVQGETVEYLASNTEYLQQANPDVILRAAHGMPAEVVEMFDREFQQNDIWKHFNAVKNGQVYDLEERLYGTAGNLAVAEALMELTRMLYP